MEAEKYEEEIERLFDLNGIDALIEHRNLTQYFYGWYTLSSSDWFELIKANPVFLEKATRFSNGQIAILACFPNRHDLCDKIDNFTEYAFAELFVLRKGEMADFPEWDFAKLDALSWLILLDFSREYEDIAKNYFEGRIALLNLNVISPTKFSEYELLSVANWYTLLHDGENFAQIASKFRNGRIVLFAKGMADFKSVNFSELNGDDWSFLLSKIALDVLVYGDASIEHSKAVHQIACNFSYWEKLSMENWCDILPYAKNNDVYDAAASRKIFKLFSSSEWVELLLIKRNFETTFLSCSDWTNLDGKDWDRLISADSYFEKYCKKFGKHTPCRSKIDKTPKVDFLDIEEWLHLNSLNDVKESKQWLTLLKSAEYPAYLDDCIEHKCWNNLPQELQEQLIRVYPHILERI